MGDSKVPKSRRRKREKRVDMEPAEIEQTIVELEEEMLAAAEELRFEYAAKLRDEIRELRRELDEAASAPEFGRANNLVRLLLKVPRDRPTTPPGVTLTSARGASRGSVFSK